MLSIEGIEVNAGLAMTGGDLDNYMAILDVFYQDGIKRTAQIRECMTENNLKLFTTHVHAVKSAAASIGASRLSEAAKNLESAGKTGDTVFIAANSESFLIDFSVLLQNIGAVLLNLSSKSPRAESGDSDVLYGELARLNDAVARMDIREIDDIIDNLSTKEWDEAITSALQNIRHCVLLFEYDQACQYIRALMKH